MISYKTLDFIIMILLNKIKYNADINYDEYETKVEQYYQNKGMTNMVSLTNYIYSFYIQRDYKAAHDWNSVVIKKIELYIKNLYIEYIKYYIEGFVSKNFIITKEIINDYIMCYNSHRKCIKYIIEISGYDLTINNFIETIFENNKNLPSFHLYDVDRKDVHICLAKLLDFIIDVNKHLIILNLILNNTG